jgi:hypothetical protein
MDIEKRYVTAVLLCRVKQLARLTERGDLRVGLGFFDG